MHTTHIAPGDLVRICRADRRWTQARLAQEADVARVTVHRIENGAHPSRRVAQKLALTLGLDVELLLHTRTAPSEDEAAGTHTTRPQEVESED